MTRDVNFLSGFDLDLLSTGKGYVEEETKLIWFHVFKMTLHTEGIEGIHTYTYTHFMQCCIFQCRYDARHADTLSYTYSPHSREVVHKECNKTVGNKGMEGHIYFSHVRIYFKLGNSSNTFFPFFSSDTYARIHTYKEKNLIFLG